MLAASGAEQEGRSESLVVRRSWAAADDYWDAPQPFAAERSGRRLRQLSDRRPAAGKRYFELGYDAADRIVLTRRADAEGTIERASYAAYGPDSGEMCTFVFDGASSRSRGQLISVAHLIYDDGSLVAVDTCWSSSVTTDDGAAPWHPWLSERYELDDARRVTRIEVGVPGLMDPAARVGDREIVTSLFAITYDGDVDTPVSVRDVSRDVLVWRRPMPGLKTALKTVEAAMVDCLRQWTEAQQPSEPVYAFLIGWSAVFPFAPTPLLAPVGHRAQIVADLEQCEPGRELWNPAEIDSPSDPLELPMAVEASLAIVRQEWEEAEDDEAPRKFYARIAKELARDREHPWPTAEEFVVVAIDATTDEQRYLERQFRASVGRELVQQFKKRGWFEFQ